MKNTRGLVVDEVTTNKGNIAGGTKEPGHDGRLPWRLSRAGIWRTLENRLSSLIRPTYDFLPCSWNFAQWSGGEVGYLLCASSMARLEHVLSGCKVVLSQGSLRWSHDQVLTRLGEVLERWREERLFTDSTTFTDRIALCRMLQAPAQR